MARPVRPTLVLALLALAGCGGGSGGADPAANPPKAPGAFTPGVALLADADVDEQVELYVADLDGDGFVKVSGPLVAGGDVLSFQWSPDRSLLAFLADKDTDDVVELYVVAAGGGTVTKVSGPLVAGGSVRDFEWAPDSARLAYRADQDEDEVFELFTTGAQGGPSVKVSGPLPPGGEVRDYGWAPDSSRVAYVSDQDEVGTYELFTSLAAGGGNVQVSGVLAPGGDVTDEYVTNPFMTKPFAWAPDASRIAYLAQQDAADALELFTSLPGGGGNAKVNAPLAPEDLLPPLVPEFAWSPDATRIAYVANQAENHEGEVFVAAPDGTENKKLLDVHIEGMFAFGLAWSPDGAYVGGMANVFGDYGGGSLFAAPAGGPAVPLAAAAGVPFRWSPDSSTVAYTADAVRTEPVEFFLGLALSGPPVSSLAPGEALQRHTLAWAPDGARLAYLTQTDLHVSFPATAYGADRVTHLHGTDRRVEKFQWGPDSAHLLFTADIAAAQKVELFVSPRDVASLRVVSPPLVFGGQVLDFEVR